MCGYRGSWRSLWVTSHTWKSHVSCTIESRHTNGSVMSHMHICEWVMSPTPLDSCTHRKLIFGVGRKLIFCVCRKLIFGVCRKLIFCVCRKKIFGVGRKLIFGVCRFSVCAAIERCEGQDFFMCVVCVSRWDMRHHTYEWVMSHIWTSHVPFSYLIACMRQSRFVGLFFWVISHIWMSYFLNVMWMSHATQKRRIDT